MWAKTSAIWLILAAAAFAQNEDEKKKEEEAKAKIADFKKELKTAKTDKDVARAIEGLGAKRDGVIRHHAARRDGSVRDTVMYSILATEWPDVKKHLELRLARHATPTP